jgi:acyl carrier protein
MTAEIRETVRDYILKEFLPEEEPRNLTDDVPLISGGILDSIATLKLVMFIEEHFGITLEAHEADRDHLDTIAQIVGMIKSKKYRGS